MRRYIVTLLLLCCAVLPLWAAEGPKEQMHIASLPAEKLAVRYDVSWTLTVNAAVTTPLQFAITQANGDGILKVVGNQLSWQPAGATAPTITVPLNLVAGSSYSLGIKRRPDTMAVLFEHRLLFAVPVSSFAGEKVAFTQVPDSVTIVGARYQRISAPLLGDDFMRPGAVSGVKVGSTDWLEDQSWVVQYYQVDNPGANPPKDAKGIPVMNPWRLSLFPMTENSANGFWYLYTGVGPSWTVGNEKMSYPFWDKYYISVAVKSDFDSTVGVIAAYQNNKNYLLFRWKQREYDTNLGHRAQLVAIIDGKETIIGEADRGFDPGQWFNIRINLGWRQAQVLVDGKLLIQGVNPGNIEGRAGMYADGVAKPRRINPDEATVKMYQTVDTKDPKRILNDSTLNQEDGTLVYFDDVKVGDWTAQENTSATGGYAFDKTGMWDTRNNAYTAISAGRYLTGSFATANYQASAKLAADKAGAGMYFHMDAAGNGYLWEIAGGVHKLQQVTNYAVTATLGTAPQSLDADTLNLRVKANGPYVALYCNDKLVLDHYDATRTKGRIGLMAAGKDVVFSEFTVTPLESTLNKVKVHNRFSVDRYMAAWATEDGEWYPVVLPASAMTPAGFPFSVAGAASPYPTNIAGLYWHKGGHYGDFRITLDYATGTLAKQKIHLGTKYDPISGYVVELDTVDNKGVARLYRKDKLVSEYTFAMTAKSQVVLERKGGYYLLHAIELVPDTTDGAVLNDNVVFAYHDATPLPANMIGFTVTTITIKASDAHVETEGVMDAFELSPTGWISESGIWAVMQKFSCQPQWNWFGGFGGGNPTVWSKYKLEGDQVVEVFEGVKMAIDAEVSAEQYALRYRDMNMTFCADGKHLNSGYSIIRGGRLAGTPTTMLVREDKVVMSSVNQEDLLPPQSTGHRVWFATRVEKRSLDGGKAEIRVYIDNHLAMTYVDEKPLTGGYVAFWTHNNGMMIARANIFAEKMTVGEPRAASPLTLKDEDTTVLPTASVTMNDVPLVIANFENDKDNFVERPGLTGRLVRDSVIDGRGVSNHFMRVINSYPSGDFSVSGMLKDIDLLKTPNLHFDYNLDMGVKVNLYLRLNEKWYEVVLTGKLAQSAVFTIGKVTAVADGGWHHFEANVGKMLVDAITKQNNGVAPTSLKLDEIDFADWSASSDMREYGFNANKGGQSYCLDNIVALPTITDKVTLTWANDKLKTWSTGLDNIPVNTPAIAATTQKIVIDPKKTLQFFHLRGTDAGGKVGGIVNIPIPGVAGN